MCNIVQYSLRIITSMHCLKVKGGIQCATLGAFFHGGCCKDTNISIASKLPV